MVDQCETNCCILAKAIELFICTKDARNLYSHWYYLDEFVVVVIVF